ncbi:MAG: DUF1294 domain-containing protein [Candidatus Omnitrophota bacterium]
MVFLIYYILSINILTFLVYAVDKIKAKQSKHRISEKWLHLLSLLGGSVGALAGQKIFRHKTAKKSFQWIFRCVLFLQALIILYVLYKSV